MRLFERTKARRGQQELPFIILDDLVCFPGSVTPLYITAKPAVRALETAMAGQRLMFVASRKKGHEGVAFQDLSSIGSIGRVLQVMKLPNNTSRLLIEAVERAQILEILDTSTEPRISVQTLELNNTVDPEIARLMRAAQESFQRYASLNKKLNKETIASIENADAPHKLVDLICAHANLSYEKRLEFLAETDARVRLEEITVCIEAESELLDLKNDISSRVKKRMEQNQKEYFLNEQIKELNRELGKEEEDVSGIKELEQKLKSAELPEDVRTRTATELKRLSRLQVMSPEAGIVRTWLEWIADLPWGPAQPDTTSLSGAQIILDQDHYDLEEPKDRILDYLAVRRLKGTLKAPILCFVGPPGTGKTSLGKSVARALGRKFIRVSLGGVRDEAEIRGHRRTYVGALPGKIIQGIRKSGSCSPVFLLDEIDKLSTDQRGDPASALLEVMDPEQNSSFVDHYLELPFDLSQVLFIATANNVAMIPSPLRDRMEIIEIPGYTRYDKLKIAEGFIVPKQLREHGIDASAIRFEPDALRCIIDEYTMEAGVRSLERHIAKVIRKIVREALGTPAPVETASAENAEVSAETSSTGAEVPEIDDSLNFTNALPSSDPRIDRIHTTLTPESIRMYLKKPRVRQDLVDTTPRIGVTYGMAWTEHGGTVMPVEVSVSPGSGELVLTGSLGDVMKESARIAVSVLRGLTNHLGLPVTVLKENDLHIHVPEGAIPKDGPSAGITLCTALASAFSGHPIDARTAMTGELTLTGRVLAVGGIREKVLAAHRHGFSRVILPEKNRVDAEDLPDEIVSEMELHFVVTIADVLPLVMLSGDLPIAISGPEIDTPVSALDLVTPPESGIQ